MTITPEQANNIWAGLVALISSLVLYVVGWLLSRREKDRAAALEEKKVQDAKIEAERKFDQAREEADDRLALALIEAQNSQKTAIDESNNRLAAALRDEMRRDNEELRMRQRDTDKELSATKARLEDIQVSNHTLRQENLELASKNGSLIAQVSHLTEQNKKLAVDVKQLQDELQIHKLDRLVLIDVLRKAGITLPPLSATY